jgi:maleylpyruvate isomerase
MTLILHDYWRSGAGFRVRLAFALKGLDYDRVSHDLRTGEQRDDAYLAIAPQGLVPSVEVDGQPISQSIAIMEWLDERFPTRPLLPASDVDRAIVRSMCGLVVCDIHPLNNLRVLTYLRKQGGFDAAAQQSWIAHWVTEGFGALETLIQRHGQGFAFGGTPTMADCCIVPQVFSARRFGIDLSAFPAILGAHDALFALPDIAAALPEAQADAD